MSNGQPELPPPPFAIDIALSLAAVLLAPHNAEKVKALATDIELENTKNQAELAGGTTEWMTELIFKVILRILNTGDPVYNAISRAAIASLLGDGQGTRSVPTDAGRRLISRLSGSAGPIQPGIDGAANYLTLFLNEEMEAWVRGVAVELASELLPRFTMIGGGIETFAKLEDIISDALGGGRMVRRVLQPFIDATAITPARWQVNKTYRPELLGVSEAVRQFARGRWSREQVFEELARQGWSDDRIEAHINAQRKFNTSGELSDMIDLGLTTYEDAVQHLQDAGYDQDTASLRIRLAQAQQVLSEKDAIGNAAVTAYAGRQIDKAEFESILNAAAISGLQLGRMRAVGEARRAMNRRELSEGDAREAVERGILSVVDYRRVLERLGYDEQAIDVKELLLISDLKGTADAKKERERLAKERAAEKAKREADAAKRRAALEEERAVTEPTIGQALALTVRGIFSFDQYAAWLAFYKYDPATIAALVDEAEQKRADYLDAQEQREAARVRASRRPVSWATLESAVMRGVVSMDTYRRRLLEEKVTAEDADIIIATLADRIREQRELEAERERLKNLQPEKELSLSQAEEAVMRGLGTLADFSAYLQGAHYTDFARTVIVELMRRRLADRDAALERRKEQEAAAAARAVPLSEIRRAVLKGVRARTAYEAALVDARIDADDRVLFLDLLDAELAELAAARAKREEAERRRAERGLSLEQLARAVILGALPIARYQQELLGDGWSAGDVDVLTALLLERVQVYARARMQREQLEDLEAFTGLTMGELARAVRQGVRLMADYAFALELKGLGEEDIATLVELLQLEMDEDAEQAAAAAKKAKGEE